MILRFTDGQRHVSFNTRFETWNNLADDPDVAGGIQFIEIPPDALDEVIKNLDFYAFSYSDDLHHELVIPDELPDEDDPPLF